MTDLDPRKHGIGESQLAILPEEATEFNRFLAGLYDDMRPSGELQRILFGQILHACWNLRLARRKEASLLVEAGFGSPSLTAVARFYSKSERTFSKAVTELRNLQTELAYRATVSDGDDAGLPDLPPLVRTAQIHKQARTATRERTVLQTWNRIQRNRSSGT